MALPGRRIPVSVSRLSWGLGKRTLSRRATLSGGSKLRPAVDGPVQNRVLSRRLAVRSLLTRVVVTLCSRLTTITFAGAGLCVCVCWQGRAGITRRALVLLLIQFYVSLQTDMNVAIQQRIRSESKRRKLKSVCVF